MKIRQIPSAYSQEQLKGYLKRIRWSGSAPTPTLECLTLLMRKHLTSIPFCTTFIVYEDPVADLDVQELYERLVHRRGGSFCFGHGLLFQEMLRAIGFRCYSTAARSNAHHRTSEAVRYVQLHIFGALGHMIVFVSLESSPEQPDEASLYLADVGFGSMRFTQPLLIRDGATTHLQAGAREEHRIHRMQHPASAIEPDCADEGSSALPLGTEFSVQYRYLQEDGQPALPWRTCFAFALNEMTVQDYASLHYRVRSAHPAYAKVVMASLLLEQSSSNDEPLGKLSLENDTLKRYIPGREVEVTKLETEAERLRVLREEFGLGNLPPDAEATIRQKGLALAQ